jgi:hypothetical protein
MADFSNLAQLCGALRGVTLHCTAELWQYWLWSLMFMDTKIGQSTIYYTGLLGRWDKRIVNQVSDDPSIIFFHDFLKNSLQKSFQFIFSFFIKLQK